MVDWKHLSNGIITGKSTIPVKLSVVSTNVDGIDTNLTGEPGVIIRSRFVCVESCNAH